MNLPGKAIDAHTCLAAAYNSGDVETVLSMYDLSGFLVAGDNIPVTGKQGFTEKVKEILSVKGKMEIKTVYCLEAGDVAIGRSEWSITHEGEVKIAAKGIELMKRQQDGTWKIIIDHAVGAEPGLLAK